MTFANLRPASANTPLMCNEKGGTIDDLYAYKLSGGVYFMVINASRVAEDVAWLQACAKEFTGDLHLTDASHNYSAVAVQGPRVKEFIDECIQGRSNCALRVGRVTDLKKNEIGGFIFGNHNVMVFADGIHRRRWVRDYRRRKKEFGAYGKKILSVGKDFGELNPVDWARVTPCELKLVTHSTGMSWTRTPRPLKRVSAFSWRWIKANSWAVL